MTEELGRRAPSYMSLFDYTVSEEPTQNYTVEVALSGRGLGGEPRAALLVVGDAEGAGRWRAHSFDYPGTPRSQKSILG